ncbi:MAG: hypothetical protein IJY08_03235 [Clostridia bacterium]|nr:hypothetical protein [Clostridia bacterium]
MKKLSSLVIALILIISTMTYVMPITAANQPSSDDVTRSNVLFSQADIKAANENDNLSSVTEGLWGTTVTYDTENDRIDFVRTAGWSYLKITAPSDKIDMTQSNWLSGKTVEFEVVMVKKASTNLTLSMHTYSEPEDPANSGYINQMNNGPAVWWYQNSSVSSVNAYPVAATESGAYEHTIAEKNIPLAEGTTLKMRMTQTADKLTHYYYDTDTKAWVAIDDGHAVSELKVNKGGLIFFARNPDTWGIKNLIIYENTASEFLGVQNTELYDTDSDSVSDSFDIRFVSTVDRTVFDSGVYSEIGFEVSASYSTSGAVAAKRYNDQYVYTSLLASDKEGNIDVIAAPEDKYFCALAIEEIPKNIGKVVFLVKPYVIENGTYVYGPTYEITYDAANAECNGAVICTDGR